MAGWIKSVGNAAVIAGVVWFLLGAVTATGGLGTLYSSLFPIALFLLFFGLIGGPILGVAGGILLAISGRRRTAREWVGWAFILSGLGWGFLIVGYLGWISSLEVTITVTILALVLIAVGVGALAWERSGIQPALRILGATIFIAGIVGVVAFVVLVVDYLFLPLVPGGLRAMSLGVGTFLTLGILWGPLLIGIGLELLYTSARRREKAAISS